jgi:hypothetical protein
MRKQFLRRAGQDSVTKDWELEPKLLINYIQLQSFLGTGKLCS